ncbi:MAG: hypothetical protein KDJ65_28805 [Anaerolineae bacterium]|nr:hypothetical protein [Anaerolineae bacterium]
MKKSVPASINQKPLCRQRAAAFAPAFRGERELVFPAEDVVASESVSF